MSEQTSTIVICAIGASLTIGVLLFIIFIPHCYADCLRIDASYGNLWTRCRRRRHSDSESAYKTLVKEASLNTLATESSLVTEPEPVYVNGRLQLHPVPSRYAV